MKPSPFLLIAALVAFSAQAQPAAITASDGRAVLIATLMQEAAVRGPENAAETCVAAALNGPPAAPGDEDGMAPDHSVRIRFQWHVPAAAPAARPVPPPFVPGQRRTRVRLPESAPPAPLAADQAAQLDALRAQAARTPAPSPIARIDASLVPAPLRLQRPYDDCAMLTLSSPAFAGDAAFVAVDYACGPVCGSGEIYALQRREGRWQIVGIADTWVR